MQGRNFRLYIYDFEVVGARNTKGSPTSMNMSTAGESEYVLLHSCATLEPAKHKIFFDNQFSSLECMKYMMKGRMYDVATLRLDRSRKCPVSSERDFKKKGRGTMKEFADSSKNLVAVSWYDNRHVLTISNFIGKEPVEECKRYDKKEEETVDLPCPASVGVYNKFMGGVDKADMLLELYKT